MAALLGVSPLSEAGLGAIVTELCDRRGALDSVDLGIITANEAVDLFLAHMHSSLPEAEVAEPMPWTDAHVLEAVHVGLFGELRSPAR